MALSTTSKLKILIPVFYLILSIVYFYISLQNTEHNTYHYIGIFITITAFVLWLVARIQLGNAFSIAPRAKYLVTTGLYSKLRHPIYYFSILALAGLAIFSWNAYIVIVVIVLTILQLYRIKKEETLLKQVFGKKYTSYKKKTWF